MTWIFLFTVGWFVGRGILDATQQLLSHCSESSCQMTQLVIGWCETQWSETVGWIWKMRKSCKWIMGFFWQKLDTSYTYTSTYIYIYICMAPPPRSTYLIVKWYLQYKMLILQKQKMTCFSVCVLIYSKTFKHPVFFTCFLAYIFKNY